MQLKIYITAKCPLYRKMTSLSICEKCEYKNLRSVDVEKRTMNCKYERGVKGDISD